MEQLSASFKVEISEWKPSAIDPNVIYYIVEILKYNQDKWTVEKRYSEFDDLNKNLKKMFVNLPSLPGKSLFKIKESEDINIRRQGLHEYLKALISRPDVFNSEPLKQFLQLDKHAQESIANPPRLLAEMTGFLHGVRDF